jgi:hypothetical protein
MELVPRRWPDGRELARGKVTTHLARSSAWTERSIIHLQASVLTVRPATERAQKKIKVRGRGLVLVVVAALGNTDLVLDDLIDQPVLVGDPP